MKKLILLTFILLSGVVSKAGDSITIKVPDTAKLTMREVYNDAKNAITGLAKALKVPAEHVYKVLVKQQVVNAIIWLVICLFLSILSIFFGVYCKKTFNGHLILSKNTVNPDIDDTSKGILAVFLGVISGILSIITLITILACIQSIVTGFINPEYGAMKDIINFIK